MAAAGLSEAPGAMRLWIKDPLAIFADDAERGVVVEEWRRETSAVSARQARQSSRHERAGAETSAPARQASIRTSLVSARRWKGDCATEAGWLRARNFDDRPCA